MILNKFLFDKEIAIVLFMCNANEYCMSRHMPKFKDHLM